jgi:hypothetical protein
MLGGTAPVVTAGRSAALARCGLAPRERACSTLRARTLAPLLVAVQPRWPHDRRTANRAGACCVVRHGSAGGQQDDRCQQQRSDDERRENKRPGASGLTALGASRPIASAHEPTAMPRQPRASCVNRLAVRRERRRTNQLTRRVSLARRCTWVLGAGSAIEPRIEVLSGADLRRATVPGVLVAIIGDELDEVQVADDHKHLVPCVRATSGAGHPGER